MFDAPALPADRPPPDPALGPNPVWRPLLRTWRARQRGERVRPKLTFDDGKGGVQLALARGTLAANAEALLLTDAFLAGLEARFGIERNDGLAVVGEVLLAILPGEYGDPAGGAERIAAATSAVRQEQAERRADPARPLRADQPAGDIVARAEQLGEQHLDKMLKKIAEHRRMQVELAAQPSGVAAEVALEAVGQLAAERADHGGELVA